MSELALGAMNGYYNYSEIIGIMNDLKTAYPDLYSMPIGGPFDELVLNNVSIVGYTKPVVFILGGLYAGNPMSALQVLYIADKIGSENLNSFDNHDIKNVIDNSIIHFIPVLNKAAYSEMENLFWTDTNQGFANIKTGLDFNATCAQNPFPGINPDRNFDFQWRPTDDNCSEFYSGTNYFTSKISLDLSNLLNSTEDSLASLVISFEDTGMKMYYPFAYSNDTLTAIRNLYYTSLKLKAPKKFDYGSYYASNNNNPAYGTLLDYAHDCHLFSFQVALDKPESYNPDNIFERADEFYQFSLSAVAYMYPNIIVSEDILDEEELCTLDSCTFYSVVLFEFSVDNIGALHSDVQIEIEYLFEDPANYSFVSAMLKKQDNDGHYSENPLTCSEDSSVLCNATIVEYSNNYFVMNFSRLVESSDKGYNISVNFRSQSIGIYLEPISLKFDGHIENGKHDDGDSSDDSMSSRELGIRLGAVLLIILLILLLITGIVLCCTRKKLEEASLPDPQRA